MRYVVVDLVFFREVFASDNRSEARLFALNLYDPTDLHPCAIAVYEDCGDDRVLFELWVNDAACAEY